jgi:hypothetical protein
MCRIIAETGFGDRGGDRGEVPLAHNPLLLDLAWAEVQLRHARAAATDADRAIAALAVSDGFAGTSKERGFEAAMSEFGLDAARRARLGDAACFNIKISGDVTLLDPVALALNQRRLMQRYVVGAEALRSRALAAWLAAGNERGYYKTNQIATQG